MYETLSDAIDAMSTPERGFHFVKSGSSESFLDFYQLRAVVQGIARKLSVLSCQPGEPVVIVFPGQAEFLQAFLSVIRAGLVAVPMPPPSLTGDLVDYVADLERVRKITGARHLLTTDALLARIQSVCMVDHAVSWSEISAGIEQGELPDVQRADTALIQFTSGSTGSPKGVELTHASLVSNALAIKQALGVDPVRDRGVSWLPLHHDMGLIGFLITPVLVQASTWYLSPLEFARRPKRWLDLMSQTQASISYAPNFGYELVARSVKPAQIEKWDLSAWRVAGCGGEAILPGVLDQFASKLQPAGFEKSAFAPSYGLAEATVAVTVSPLQRGVVTHSDSPGSGHIRSLVSVGTPVAGTEVRIVSSSGEARADQQEGEVQVRGPGVAKRFWSNTGHSASTTAEDWLSNGDLGMLKQGELYICGRIKETVLLNGRNYYPHDIEECVRGLNGVKRGGVVAFGRPGTGSEQLVLVAESGRSTDAGSLRRKLRESVRKRLGLSVSDVVIVGRGVISRTTSGKLQRSALRAKYLRGELCELAEPA